MVRRDEGEKEQGVVKRKIKFMVKKTIMEVVEEDDDGGW